LSKILPGIQDIKDLEKKYSLLTYSTTVVTLPQIRPKDLLNKQGWRFIPVVPDVMAPTQLGIKYFIRGFCVKIIERTSVILALNASSLWESHEDAEKVHDYRKLIRPIFLLSSQYPVFRPQDQLDEYEKKGVEMMTTLHQLLGYINDCCNAYGNFYRAKDWANVERMEREITSFFQTAKDSITSNNWQYLVAAVVNALIS